MMPATTASLPVAPPPVYSSLKEFVRANWRWHVLLTLPFVVTAIYLLSTGLGFMVFWGHDEYGAHWPMMQRLARELPHMNWKYDDTASTPLFQLIGAGAVDVVGPNLQAVRMLNAVFCLGGVFALFGMLCRYRHLAPWTAALLTAAFMMSCYFFGYSFRLLTDGMAVVWCIYAMSRLYRFVDPTQNAGLPTYLWGCLWLGAAIFTRQSYIFMGLPFFVTLLGSPLSNSRKVIGLVGLALAIAPFAALVVVWHGLVPPAFQPRHVPSLVSLYAVALPLMLLGIYIPFFHADAVYRGLTTEGSGLRRLALPVGAAFVGLVIVALFPLDTMTGQHARAGYIPEVAWFDPPGYFAGWIYTASGHLPILRGNSLLFWVLLPCGLAAAAVMLRALFQRDLTVSARLSSWFLLAILVSSVLNSISVQKYYDGAMLFLVISHYPEGQAPRRLGKVCLTLMIVIFCLYQVSILRRPQTF